MLPYIAAPWILWAMSWPIFRQTQSGFCSLDGADVRDVNILEIRRRARCRAKSSRKKKRRPDGLDGSIWDSSGWRSPVITMVVSILPSGKRT